MRTAAAAPNWRCFVEHVQVRILLLTFFLQHLDFHLRKVFLVLGGHMTVL